MKSKKPGFLSNSWLRRILPGAGPAGWRPGGWILTGWSLLLAYRGLFAVVFYEGTDPAETARQFFCGLRFDLATLPLLIGPALLLEPFFALIQPARLRARATRVWLIFQVLWLGALSILLGAGFLEFYFNQKYPGPEFYTYFTDAATLAGGLLRTDASLVVLAIIPGLVITAAGLLLIRAIPLHEPAGGSPKLLPLTVSRLLIFGALALLLRGGFQAAPLRPADALPPRESSAYLGHLPLNALFTVYHAGRETGDFPVFFDHDSNVEYVRHLYGRPVSPDEPAEFPLLARMPERTHSLLNAPSGADAGSRVFRPHIVVFLLESFSASFLAEGGGDPNLTPFLNRLVNESVYFPRFFSAGGRSANAIFSMLTGIPDRAGRTILRSPGIQNRFGALPALLKRSGQRSGAGYRTSFIHGGDLRFDSLDRVLPRFGFDTVSGRPNDTDLTDAESLSAALRIIDRDAREGPTFSVLFTVGTHHPYQQGPSELRVTPGRTPAERLRNSVAATDRSLEEFIENARRRPWFGRTIFVFVADHSHHAGLNFLEDLHLPLLFYAPRLLKAARNDRVGTHLDLHPTLLALAGGGGTYAALGRDLFAARDPVRGGFFTGGSRTDVIGWIGEERLCLVWPGLGRSTIYSSRFPADLFQRNFVEHRELERCADRARHVYQLARVLERSNRVWPADPALQ